MKKKTRPYTTRLQSNGFTLEKRRRHLAHQVAPSDEGKQSIVRSLPLFDVALLGRDALPGRGVRK